MTSAVTRSPSPPPCDFIAQPNAAYVESTDPVGSEDHCLELDIYIAEGVTNAKTVLMYIHGGAHDYGE